MLQASKTDTPCSPVVEHLPDPLTKPQRQVGIATLRVGYQEASSSHKLSHFRGTARCSHCGVYSSLLAPFKLLGKVCQGPAKKAGSRSQWDLLRKLELLEKPQKIPSWALAEGVGRIGFV